MKALSGRRRKALATILVANVAGTVAARLLGYSVGGYTVVRCRQGHLFTTIWIPGVKLRRSTLSFPARARSSAAGVA